MTSPDNTKLIPLTQGKFAIVDDEDFDWLMKWKWCYIKGGYAFRTNYLYRKNGKQKCESVYMHRLIMNEPIGMDIDHIDGDKLNNRRCNLRICSHSCNQCNQKKRITLASSKYKGVSWCKIKNKWRVRLRFGCNQLFIGYFDSEIFAAIAWNQAAEKHHGEFARLNVLLPQ